MKKRNYSKKQLLLIVGVSLLMILLSVILNHIYPVNNKSDVPAMNGETVSGVAVNNAPGDAPGETAKNVSPSSSQETADVATAENKEEKIASFLQGPKSWNEKRYWSGEWGDAYYDGGNFGGFGCGLCCMANLYTSLTPYECSPLDMYKYAKKKTAYTGGGAIGWGYIKQTLNATGFVCEIGKKPSSYENFQKKAKQAQAMIVVVSSNDSDCYWKDTPGHYVTLFLYDSQTDKAFLADSGNPEHNRQRISLKKVYRSLKMANDWQYLAVTGYEKEADTWKHKGFGGNCILPEEYEEEK